MCGLDSSGSGQGPVAGCCEHGNETSGSIKGGEFLLSAQQLSACQGINFDGHVPTQIRNFNHRACRTFRN
jgi:hypothetical protein